MGGTRRTKEKTRTGHKATEGNKVWQRRGDRHLCDDWSETNSSSVPSCVRGHPSSDSFLPRTTPLGTGTGSRFCVAPCTCMPNKEPVVRTQDHADKTTPTKPAQPRHARHIGIQEAPALLQRDGYILVFGCCERRQRRSCCCRSCRGSFCSGVRSGAASCTVAAHNRLVRRHGAQAAHRSKVARDHGWTCETTAVALESCPWVGWGCDGLAKDTVQFLSGAVQSVTAAEADAPHNINTTSGPWCVVCFSIVVDSEKHKNKHCTNSLWG